MRDLVVIEFITLDGVMQGLGSPDEDRDGGFAHGGWGAEYVDEVQMAAAARGLERTTAYLLGRRTYEKMAGFWPAQPDSNPMAAHLNRTPKHVVTGTLRSLEWNAAEPLDSEVGPGVAALKAKGEGDIAVLGSGLLVHELMRLRLVDEYRVFLHPLLLGTGKRLFRDLPAPQRLLLADAAPTSTGVVLLTYRAVDDHA